MRPFSYAKATAIDQALDEIAVSERARFVAGGTNLFDLMKDNVETPPLIIDINALPLAAIEPMSGGIRIGALARMSDTADHPLVMQTAPAVSRALIASASPQLRNMASIGGNLMQRTRCAYFRDISQACNKRSPGNGCAAIDGQNRRHAVLGVSDRCICTHPSDLAVALLTTDAVIETRWPGGTRSIAIQDFHVLPNPDPSRETVLQHGELITSLTIPASTLAARARYLKLRDRASFEFALVSVAASYDAAGGVIRAARLGLGGVAPIPWRATAAEQSMIGKPVTEQTFAQAAEIALEGAVPRDHNAFKIGMTKRAIVRAFTQVSA